MQIKIAHTKAEREDALHVRKLVFVHEQDVPEEIEVDHYENEAIHFIGYQHSQSIAAGRLRFLDHYGKIERLCVLKKYRGNSFGLQMLQRMEEETLKHQINHTLLHAQTIAVPFYERVGYEIVSEPFNDAGISHVTMTKRIK